MKKESRVFTLWFLKNNMHHMEVDFLSGMALGGPDSLLSKTTTSTKRNNKKQLPPLIRTCNPLSPTRLSVLFDPPCSFWMVLPTGHHSVSSSHGTHCPSRSMNLALHTQSWKQGRTKHDEHETKQGEILRTIEKLSLLYNYRHSSGLYQSVYLSMI